MLLGIMINFPQSPTDVTFHNSQGNTMRKKNPQGSKKNDSQTMTAKELAEKLLQYPDHLVYVDGLDWISTVTGVDVDSSNILLFGEQLSAIP